MDENIKELQKYGRTIDMMLSMHSSLRDRYHGLSLIVDVLMLIASILLLITGFLDPAFTDKLHISRDNLQVVSRITSVIIFTLSVLLLRINWKGMAVQHGRACEVLAKLKSDTKLLVLDKDLTDDKVRVHKEICSVAMAPLGPIPERLFHMLKARHLKKVALSKALDFYPHCPIWIIKLGLFCKHTKSAVKNKFDSLE